MILRRYHPWKTLDYATPYRALTLIRFRVSPLAVGCNQKTGEANDVVTHGDLSSVVSKRRANFLKHSIQVGLTQLVDAEQASMMLHPPLL